ncbi:CDP-glycerol glycerophosphotransferase family protein, partial [Streptomyces sp. AC627_RSS907]
HPEQRERLRRACPAAEKAAVIAGDPAFDRMLAARPHRERYRRALGVRRGQRLVVLNSTWNPEGFFGDGGGQDMLPGLLPRLAAELPADDYRLAAVLHPNIWHGHGPGQIRVWLDRARRGGLALIDPVHGWRQALLAADAVIGDFGAVSYYAAALGTPVLLAAHDQRRLDPEAPLADFVRQAPRLD